MARPSGSFESLVWCVVVALSGSDHLSSAAIALDKKERPILRPALALLRTLGSLNEAHMEEAIRRAKSSILVLAEFLSKFQGMNAYDCLRSLMGLLGEHGGEHGAWDVLDDLAGSRWCIHCHCTEKACDGIFEKLDLCTVVHVRDNLNSFSLQESEPMLCPKCQIQSVTISKCLHQPIPKCLLVLVANKGGTVKVSHSLEIQLNGEPERSLRYELKSLVWHTKTNWKSCFSTHGVFISSEGGTGTLRDPALLSTSHCEPVLAVYDKADDIVPSYSQRSLCDQGRQSPATPESNASRRKRKAKRQQGRRAEVETLSSFEKLLLKEEAEVEHVPSQRRKRNRAASSEPEIVDVLRGKDNAGGSLSLGRKHGVPYTHGHVERLMEPRGWLTSQILDLRLKQLQLRFPQNFYFNTSFFGLLCPGGFQSGGCTFSQNLRRTGCQISPIIQFCPQIRWITTGLRGGRSVPSCQASRPLSLTASKYLCQSMKQIGTG
jgi:hypothetical protein